MPVPIVFPTMTDAVEEAPTDMDFTSRNRVDAALFAAMAAALMCPNMTVCRAVLSPPQSLHHQHGQAHPEIVPRHQRSARK